MRAKARMAKEGKLKLHGELILIVWNAIICPKWLVGELLCTEKCH